MTYQTNTFPLINLEMARQSDVAGVMALRAEFGDNVVDIIHAELPYLEPTLAVTAHLEDVSPRDFVKTLRRSIDTLMDGDEQLGDLTMGSDYDHTVATHLIHLIDPAHEDKDRRSLGNLLSSVLEQILEDNAQPAFAR